MSRTAARAWTIVVRAALPALLLVGGIASVVYGVVRHTAVVAQEQEIEIDVAPPPGFGPPGVPGFLPGGGPGDPSLGGPPVWMGPPPEMRKVKQKVLLSETTSELTLIREVTFGGVTRLDTGVLWRTYTGAPPSLCPT
jgi:hypothetical protein